MTGLEGVTSVLAVDPSLAGCGVASATGPDTVEVQEFCTPPSGPSVWARLARYRLLGAEIARCAMPGEAGSCLVLIEGYSMASKGRGTLDRVEFGAMLRQTLYHCSRVLAVVEVSPSSLKKFACGKGNASKVAVATALAKRYGCEFASDNTADAFALAQLGMCVTGVALAPNKVAQAVVDQVGELVARELEAIAGSLGGAA